MKRDILCYNVNCSNKTDEQLTIKTNKPKRGRKLCPSCRIKKIEKQREILSFRNKNDLSLRLKNSIRMKANNPSFLKRKEKVFKLKETKEQTSERMKLKNPMFDKDVVEKAKKTKRIKGYKYKKGIKHHLWKGNRDFNNVCRCQLYTIWIKKILERDKFKCSKCNTHNHLQVHHIKPLRVFIKEIKIKYAIKTFLDIEKGMWQKYIDEIIASHTLADGITLCKFCHEEIDKFYHKPKTYEN